MLKRFLLLVITCAGLISNAATESTVQSKDIEDKIAKSTNDYLASHFFNGTYIFENNDKVITQGAKGIYSETEKKSLVLNQVMPIASSTKSITAAAIMKLRDKKLLEVNDTIDKFLTKDSGLWSDNTIPEWASKISIHNLLTHSTGLPEYFGKASIDITKSLREINKDILKFASTHQLTFEPGKKFQYSNTNYIILGLIIEQISGKELSDFFQEELFKPNGMTNTRLITKEEAVTLQTNPDISPLPNRYFVTPTNQAPQFTEAKSKLLMIPFADGGVASTVSDMIKWQKALHSGKIVSPESYQLMTAKYFKNPKLRFGKKTYVGYGLYITVLANKDIVYNSPGSAIAIRSETGFIPSKNIYYAILSNVSEYLPKNKKDKIDQTKAENQLDIFYLVDYVLNNS